LRKEILQELQNFLKKNFPDFHIGRGYRNPAQVLSAKERSRAISIVPASDTQKRLNTKKQITWRILLIVSLQAETPQDGVDALAETLEKIETAVEKTNLSGKAIDVNVTGSIVNPEISHPFYEAALEVEVLYRR